MSIRIDHVLIFDDPGGPAAARLEAFGLTRGGSWTHPGQGTANHCYFFDNGYLELVWIADRVEAAAPVVRPLGLAERAGWRTDGTSPFGIALAMADGDRTPPPFPTFTYRAPYLPAGAAIAVAESLADADAPLVFRIPAGRRGAVQPAGGFRRISDLWLTLPAATGTEMQALQDLGLVRLRQGPGHHLEIAFDGAPRGRREDFRPALPLSIRY